MEANDPSQAQSQTDPNGAAANGPQGQQGAQAQQPDGDAADWKAKSRMWEQRAKDNKAKADKWDALQEQAPTVEGLKAEIDQMKREKQAAEAAAAHSALLLQVSQQTGVPADLLKGDTAEEMQASAELVNAFVLQNQPGYPVDKGAGAAGRAVTRESIEAIKDPAVRIAARAQHLDLYK